MALRDLYQEIIIDHSKMPRNFGKLTDLTHSQMGNNPLCGDQLIVYVKVKSDALCEIKFEGSGCAICIASASLMTDVLKNKTITEFENLFDDFHQLVTLGESKNDLGKLSALAGVIEFPIRVKCATLAWHTLRAALFHEKKSVSTE